MPASSFQTDPLETALKGKFHATARIKKRSGEMPSPLSASLKTEPECKPTRQRA